MKTVSQLLLSIAISIYAFLPSIVDLTSSTHVFHPQWLPHARMHTVWLLGITFSVGIISLYLTWSPKVNNPFALHLAATLSLAVLGAFFVSAATVGLYGGALSDQTGSAADGPFGIESNLFVFGIATLFLLAGWLVGRRHHASRRST